MGYKVYETEDDVLDLIMSFPEEIKTACLKFLSSNVESDSMILLDLDGGAKLLILKFVLKDATELCAIEFANKQEIIGYLQVMQEQNQDDARVLGMVDLVRKNLDK